MFVALSSNSCATKIGEGPGPQPQELLAGACWDMLGLRLVLWPRWAPRSSPAVSAVEIKHLMAPMQAVFSVGLPHTSLLREIWNACGFVTARQPRPPAQLQAYTAWDATKRCSCSVGWLNVCPLSHSSMVFAKFCKRVFLYWPRRGVIH